VVNGGGDRAARRALLAQIAEAASAGVRHHLRRRDLLVASALQSFAALAWAAADGAADGAALRDEAERALDRLARVRGAQTPRMFLAGAIERLDATAPRRGPTPLPLDRLEDLPSRLAARGGFASVRAGSLRDAVGARRLDAATRLHLEALLDAHGIGLTPGELPADARAWVRLHLRDHPAGLVLAAAERVGPSADVALGLALAVVGAGVAAP